MRDPRANYKQSLSVLEHARSVSSELVTKSSLMLGVGETDQQVLQTLRGTCCSIVVIADHVLNECVCVVIADLRNAGVECLTLAQYMQPTKWHLKVTVT